MKGILNPIIVAGLVFVGAQAIADDSTPSATNKDQMMKDCMAKQKATNGGMTQSAMETVCKNQVEKQEKDGNDLATGTQANKPPYN